MKSIILLLFVIGIVLLTIGYQKQLMTSFKTEKIIEYRFIPRSIYDEQFEPINLTQTYSDMFKANDVFIDTKY